MKSGLTSFGVVLIVALVTIGCFSGKEETTQQPKNSVPVVMEDFSDLDVDTETLKDLIDMVDYWSEQTSTLEN